MPQIHYQKSNGQTRIRLHKPEDKKVRDVIKLLRYVQEKRDADCILTENSGKMADDLAAWADALAKPARRKAVK